MSSILDNLYDIQSQKGSLTKLYRTGYEKKQRELEKEIIDIVGVDLWSKYTEISDKMEVSSMEVHYKEGLKDGAKLVIELIK